MRSVVDTCLAAKWLAQEMESVQAEALLHDELLAPDLLFACAHQRPIEGLLKA